MNEVNILTKEFNIHRDYYDFFLLYFSTNKSKYSQELLSFLLFIIETRPDTILPQGNCVFKAFQTSLNEKKLIVLGQDPYPQQGAATGLAFEVGNIESWDETFKNTSLKNIVRLLYKFDKNELKKYSEILVEMRKGNWKIESPKKLFKEWEKRGVLLLNTSLTVEKEKPNSHKEIWRDFSQSLIGYLSKNHNKIEWLLWGAEAQNKKKSMEFSDEDGVIYPKIIESSHPAFAHIHKDFFDINKRDLAVELT